MQKLKVSSKDAIIIKELLKDARKDFSQIAKELGITTTAVRNRFLNMRQSGIITGSTILIDPRSLGLNCYGYLGVKAHPKKINEVKEFLKKQPSILATWDKTQAINLGNFFAVPDIEDFSELKEKLKNIPGVQAIQQLIYLGSGANQFPDNLQVEPQKFIPKETLTIKDLPSIQEDILESFRKTRIQFTNMRGRKKIDQEILRFLSLDARTSFNNIAKKMNVSPVCVMQKFNNLKNKKMFFQSGITVNLQKLGYTANAMVYIKLRINSEITKIYNQISSIPNVISLTRVMGVCDILAIIPLKDYNELFNIETKIRKIKGIKKIHINLNPTFTNWPVNFFSKII
jgi:Lrp/AsnC family transcriptional regulator for asnA, asnC and gidA